MSDDTRREDEPQDSEELTDRREFLKQAGLVGGGTLAILAGLASNADAAEVLRLKPQLMTMQVAAVRQHSELFAKIKPEVSGALLPAGQLRDAMTSAKLQPADRLAAVSILQMQQRFNSTPDVGRNIATLFALLAVGMEDVKGFNPRAAGNTCGSGCGYGCMSGAASGFICGNGCMAPEGLENELAMRAGGFICGNSCAGAGLQDLTIDMDGQMLGDVNFAALNMAQVAASMNNAAQAYNQVFAR